MSGSAILGVVALAAVVVVLLLWAGRALLSLNIQAAEAKSSNEALGRNLQALSEALARRIESFEKTIDDRINRNQTLLGQSLGTMQQQTSESSKILKTVGEEIGRVAESSKKIQELAGGVTRLEDLLKPPKIRGLLGEALLEAALRQVLPPKSYELQKSFADGEVVDAAITLGGRFVPIDSKFPYEQFRRAHELQDPDQRRSGLRQLQGLVRKQVDDIARKYIRVSEGTFDFAFMYIPAEGVYAELIVDEEEGNLADYAMSRRVIPVSPRLLYAYLFTVAQGLRGMEIEKRAHEVLEDLARLKRGIGKIEEPLTTLGKHLTNAVKQYDETTKQLSRFSEQMRTIEEGTSGLDEEEGSPLGALTPS